MGPLIGRSQFPPAPDGSEGMAKAGPYNTVLPAEQEQAFQKWVSRKNVNFDVNAAPDAGDYDMRGFYAGLVAGSPQAHQGTAGDGLMHYSDYWKKPNHPTFSQDSQWAVPGKAPQWKGNDRIA